MIKPDFSQFKKLAQKSNLIPVYREILADTETPVSAFYKLSHSLKTKYAYLLESVEQGERLGRYTFLGAEPFIVFQAKQNKVKITRSSGTEEKYSDYPLDELKKIMKQFVPADCEDLPRFWGGAVGYVAYDYVRYLENLPNKNVSDTGVSDCMFMVNDHLLIFDHVSHKIKIVSCVFVDKKSNLEEKYNQACEKIEATVKQLKKPLVIDVQKNYADATQEIKSNLTQKQFCQKVEACKEYINAGDVIQVVLSQRFTKPVPTKNVNLYSFDIYRALRTINPSPYMFYLKFDDLYLVGSSPEILVRKEGENSEVRPIAGTRPRGTYKAEEVKLEKDLLADPKERAEHLMLVDLGRNDLGRVCKYGSVKVPEFMVIERYSHVIHLVSSVLGKLNKKYDTFDLFNACFPAGTVSGAPKIRAMEIIEEVETIRRGTYAGSAGYFSFQGNMDMAITIRTIAISNGNLYIQAGAGLVADSVPENEYQESKNKAKALFKAIEIAERGL